MTGKFKRTIMAAGIVPMLALGVGFMTPAIANAVSCESNISAASGAKCAKSDEQKSSLKNSIKTVTNVLLFIIGAVAVIMIVIGGIRYTTSNGDASQVTAAKNTILYGVIGVIVALLAYAIVSFVVNSFVPDDSTPAAAVDDEEEGSGDESGVDPDDGLFDGGEDPDDTSEVDPDGGVGSPVEP